MPREKELYREYIARLDEKFPDKDHLSQKECATFLGKDPRTIKRRYGISRDGILKLQFAKILS